jgi:hypothetical protein
MPRVYYKDNPDLKLPTVKTINGETEYRKNCRKMTINSEVNFYILDKDVHEIDGHFYTINGGKIEYDHEDGTWNLKGKKSMISGIVDFGPSGPIIGKFTKNKFNNCDVRYRGSKITAINSDILIKAGYIEDISSCLFYPPEEVSSDSIREFAKIKRVRDYTDKGYNIEDNAEEFADKVASFKDSPIKISKGARKWAKYLEDITWG